ncbi:hypothetical protein K9M74_05305 [Candidatus Woesearchaeota archaeon]|nr:hypothetical protein [Candidatus Woesearchaeota archaeon]
MSYPNPQTKERKQIQEIVDSIAIPFWDFSSISKDIRIQDTLRDYVCQNYSIKSSMDCVGWCFGKEYSSNSQLMRSFYNSATKTLINDASLVWYVDNETPVHVGKLVSDKQVLSKWGRGHLINHPLESVPQSYGDKIIFSKDIPRDFAYALWAAIYDEPLNSFDQYNF